MKKYSDEHLESIEPEMVVGLEQTFEVVKSGDCSRISCPTVILRKQFGASDGVFCDNTKWLCPQILQYGYHQCPCRHYGGSENCAENIKNFLDQWKKWAGIDE